jgi:hypoxanthine phosphoribosyltransferase
MPWRLACPDHERQFAHPAELDFSRILSYYRVRWAYEPTTFALAWNGEGHPVEMFTPDFYLPDHRIYIELTTMRQRLVTRKNRKLRRMRELYPTVRVKLLYRKDYHRLIGSYGPSRLQDSCRIGRPLYTAEEINQAIDRVAQAVRERVQPADPLLILTVGRGAATFSQALAGALERRGVPLERDSVRLTRFRSARGAGRVRVRRGPRRSVAGRRVLIVADIISTGLSLAYLASWLRRHGIQDVTICTLLDRKAARLVDLPPVEACFDAPNELLVGFGLRLLRRFSELPYIATIVAGPAVQEAPRDGD